MNNLIETMSENMQLFGFSQRTQETYLYHVNKLIEHFNKQPEEISNDEIRQCFLFLRNNKKYSRATLTIVLCAKKFFLEKNT